MDDGLLSTGDGFRDGKAIHILENVRIYFPYSIRLKVSFVLIDFKGDLISKARDNLGTSFFLNVLNVAVDDKISRLQAILYIYLVMVGYGGGIHIIHNVTYIEVHVSIGFHDICGSEDVYDGNCGRRSILGMDHDAFYVLYVN